MQKLFAIGLLYILLSSVFVNAQTELEFAPVGAEWWYHEYQSYKVDTIVYFNKVPTSITVIDEIIDNLSFDDSLLTNTLIKVFEECSYYDLYTQPDTICSLKYAFEKEDKVFQVIKNSGDYNSTSNSIMLDIAPNLNSIWFYDSELCEFHCGCDSNACPHPWCVYETQITEAQALVVNDSISLKAWELYTFASTESEYSAPFGLKHYEVIGSDRYLFSCNKNFGYHNYILLCYKDEFIEYKFTEFDCTEITEGSLVHLNTDLVSNSRIQVYPNQLLTENILIVDSESNLNNCSLQIMDTNGKIIFQKKINGERNEIDLPLLNSGFYICKIVNKSNIIYTSKIIKL